MVQRIAMAPQGPEFFTFCNGLLASHGLEDVHRRFGWLY